ncbi:MAG: hypothetical protein AABZ61_02680, partial [Bacteroidota bacterium]
GQKPISHLPIPRGIEFLLLFGSLQEAEKLTEAGVAIAESLMADLSLKPCPWIENVGKLDNWDVLLSRLQWPSAIVKERTASELCDLLLSPVTSECTFNRICAWLRDARLESLVIVGLMPVAKAVRRNPIGVALNFEELNKAVTRASLASDLLMAEIAKNLQAAGRL